MLKEYQISNFKVFAGPETLPIKPITLIFGPNSSGKSSILQSLLMLKQTLDDRENPQTPLLLKGDLVDLGSYRELIHRHEVERSFSLKITLPMQGNLDEPFQYPWIVSAYGDGGLSELEETLKDFQTVAIRITFSHGRDSAVIDVSQIDLFLGDNPLPVITYEWKSFPSLPKYRPAYGLRVRCLNENHEYWSSHWKTFDEADDSYVRRIVEDSLTDPVESEMKTIDKMSPVERQIHIRKLLAVLTGLEKLAESITEEEDKVTGTVDRDVPKLLQEEKDRILSLKGLELALEAYKILSESDMSPVT